MNIKGINTIICSALFLLAGTLTIGFQNDRASPSMFPGNATAYADNYAIPKFPVDGLPLDIQLDLKKRAVVDTVYIEKIDTVYEYKTKIRKVAAPKVVEKTDTLFVPVFYITTPLEYEVKSTEIRVIDNVQVDSLPIKHQTDLFIINK